MCTVQGIDLEAGGRNKTKHRTAPKSDNVYLKLLVKVGRADAAGTAGACGLGAQLEPEKPAAVVRAIAVERLLQPESADGCAARNLGVTHPSVGEDIRAIRESTAPVRCLWLRVSSLLGQRGLTAEAGYSKGQRGAALVGTSVEAKASHRELLLLLMCSCHAVRKGIQQPVEELKGLTAKSGK